MNTKFQSRTFTHPFDNEGLEAFKKDIEFLSEVHPEKIETIIDFIKKVICVSTEREEIEVYDEMVNQKIVPSRQAALLSHRAINFFFEKFYDEKTKEDTLEEIFSDLIVLGFKEENLLSIKKLLNLLKKESQWYEQHKLKKSFSAGLLPSFKGVGTTVELRGVFNRRIYIGEKIDSYIKDVKINKENPIVPIISIAITLDSGTPDRFCFQTSPGEVEWLIEELKSSLHKSKMLEGEFNIKKNG